MKKIKIVVGATASGKSRFAMEYCTKYNGEIVSCDSMQIYQGLDIGTAKPSKLDMQQVRHHCIDIAHPNQAFSVAEWQKYADTAIEEIVARNKMPVVVGGTGLFFKALLYQHNFVATDSRVQSALQLQLKQFGSQHMHDELSKIDSVSAKELNPNDTKRVLRALEIYLISGKPKSHYKIEIPQKRYNFEKIEIKVERESLYTRIEQRVDEMMASGLLQEVDSLKQYRDCQSMQGLGYKQLIEYLDGKINLDDSIALIKKCTRNYAKRQLTYFRNFDKYTS